MRINRLIVKGYRNLKDINIEFPDSNMIAFIGNNGSGKSSILENIAETFFLAKDIENVSNIYYMFDYTYSIDSNQYRIENENGTFFHYKNGAKDIRNLKNDLPKVIFTYYAGETNRLNSFSNYFQQSYDNYLRTKTDDNIDLKFVTSFSLKDFPLAFFANYVFETTAFGKIKELLGFTEVYEPRLQLHFKKPYWASESGSVSDIWGARGFNKLFFDKLIQEDEEYGVGPFIEFDSDEDSIDLAVGHSDLFRELAETPLALYTKLKAMLDSGFLAGITIFVKKDGESIPLSFFSEGEKQLANLLMLLDLTKEYKALFLLDEFDAYLHPNWQRDFVKMVSDIDIRGQVFFTTHSPASISKLRRDNVFRMRNGEADNPERETYNRALNEIMIEQMDVGMRAPDVEELYDEFKQCIADGNKEKAEFIMTKLKVILDEKDPIFIKMRLVLRRI